eukprot:2259585-Prymnesium_polylepis.2
MPRHAVDATDALRQLERHEPLLRVYELVWVADRRADLANLVFDCGRHEAACVPRLHQLRPEAPPVGPQLFRGHAPPGAVRVKLEGLRPMLEVEPILQVYEEAILLHIGLGVLVKLRTRQIVHGSHIQIRREGAQEFAGGLHTCRVKSSTALLSDDTVRTHQPSSPPSGSLYDMTRSSSIKSTASPPVKPPVDPTDSSFSQSDGSQVSQISHRALIRLRRSSSLTVVSRLAST